MKKVNFKSLALVAFLVIAFCITAIPALAATDSKPIYEWELSDGMQTLENQDREYQKYELPVGYFIDFEGAGEYYFSNYVNIDGYYEASITSYDRDGGLLIVHYYDFGTDGIVYATEEGRKSVEALINDTPSYYRMFYSFESTEIDAEFVGALADCAKNEAAKITVDVQELKNVESCSVRGYDSTYTVWREEGMIFEYNDGIYYLDFDALDNSSFDANGNLSFRSGSLELYRLDDSSREKFTAYGEEMEYWYSDAQFEDDGLYLEWLVPDESGQLVKFWVIFSLVGYALPAALTVMGILFARSAKRGKPRYWYIISVLGAVWLVLCVVITAIIV